MGIYNPYAPQILGQEWVPIQDENVAFAPAVNVYEVGHRFTTTSSSILRDARFYINTFPPGRSFGQVFTAAIYNQGNENASGPVRSVIIPCNSVLVSGGASGTAADLMDPSDNNVVVFPSTGTPFAHMHFATNSYSQLLNGKRIVGVNFLYTLANGTQPEDVAPIGSLWGTLSVEEGPGGSIAVGLGAAQTQNSTVGSLVTVAELGEIDHFWGGGSPNSTSERLPWGYQGLQDFEVSGSSSRLSVTYRHQTNAGWIGYMNYAAMEVLFCEENRLYYGGKSFGEAGFALAHELYVMGANLITMRDTSYTASPTLAAGNYTLVIASADLGNVGGPVGLLQRQINLSQYPLLNGLRQLYAMPAHHGIQVNVTKTVDQVFTDEEVMVLPQLSLHTSSGPLTEVHVYGRQAAAQVYGSITATQEILDSAAGGARSYPWVRYYARRFGDTSVPLRLDSPSIAGSSVDLSPEDFDDLDEIVDGWKEVTLRFDTPPTMGTGTQPTWRWSAAGETAGSRWEVMGAIAPALSGIPGNLLNLIPSPHQLSIATYGQPVSGASVNLGWVPQYAPPVSATVDDQTSDAALIFAQDLPMVTGFGADNASQEITGIGLDCGIDPCCIPTAIDYVQVTWGLPPNTAVVEDTFTRVSVGWGTADSGQAYTDVGGTVPGDYVVTGTEGTHVLNSTNVIRRSIISGPIVDSHQRVIGSLNVAPAGASIRQRMIGHFVDTSNYDYVDFRWAVNGKLEIVVANFIGGSTTQLSNVSAGPIAAEQRWYYDVDFNGGTIRAKAWIVGTPEPDYQASGAAAFTSGDVGLASIRTTGNTDAGAISSFDDYSVGPSTWSFGYYELQRMDTVTTEWQIIMKATDPTTVSFNDYEARVGTLSSYRIRAVDVYDFPGPWSSTVTATVPEPGVTIGCDDGHLLIFTSNERQDGSINLAYSSVWEGRVEESFAFPEAGFVQLQAMYNRDYFTAFRPTERGGEQFSRTVLVQAAAISPETLADFTGLRDMAWADVSYICVRDEDGNRWFATVLVPSGRVLRDRRLYMAPIDIIEVTDTPSEVDP